MTLVSSKMVSLGTKAPDFHLPDVTSGKIISLQDFVEKKALLLVFLCGHCPYVIHVKAGLAKLGRDYGDKDLAMVAISSNDPSKHSEDSPESLAQMAKEESFTFPVLYDETQEAAKAYSAACTPDPFLFDENRSLVYRGQLDDSRPGNGIPVTGKDIRNAIDAVLSGREVPTMQKPSIGCSIKWKPGNEPDYFK
ncbi:thioredoxin family protein [Patescibacteria group bacterium]|nr:thioredoxin family protein [Patescibacteria group bacterium]